MTSTQTLAIVLYSLGAVAAIVGPLIAAVRLISRYGKAKATPNTRAELNAFAERARDQAKGDAWWGVAEFGLVALGVVLAAIASVVLVVTA